MTGNLGRAHHRGQPLCREGFLCGDPLPKSGMCRIAPVQPEPRGASLSPRGRYGTSRRKDPHGRTSRRLPDQYRARPPSPGVRWSAMHPRDTRSNRCFPDRKQSRTLRWPTVWPLRFVAQGTVVRICNRFQRCSTVVALERKEHPYDIRTLSKRNGTRNKHRKRRIETDCCIRDFSVLFQFRSVFHF